MFRRFIMCVVVLTLVVVTASAARADLLSYEGFSGYTVGDLDGQTHQGTGYAGNWSSTWSGAGTLSANGLTYSQGPTSLNTSGGAAVTYGASGGETAAKASFDTSASSAFYASGLVDGGKIGGSTVNNKTLFLSFLVMNNTGGIASTFGSLDLLNGSTSTFDFGQSWESTRYGFVSTFGATTSTVPVDLSVHLVVAQFDFSSTAGNDSVKVWVDPDMTKGPSQGGQVTPLTKSGDISFDSIRFRSGNYSTGLRPFTFDEIRLGTTWSDVGMVVPEPNTLILFASGLAALLAYAWRRRK
jgi:hypothetical protein